MIKEDIQRKTEQVLQTVKVLLDRYDFSTSWPGHHGKMIRRLHRLMTELDKLRSKLD